MSNSAYNNFLKHHVQLKFHNRVFILVVILFSNFLFDILNIIILFRFFKPFIIKFQYYIIFIKVIIINHC